MSPVPIVDLAELISEGTRAARHLGLVWRDLVKGPDVFEDAYCFRLLSGEAHPLGNLAILAKEALCVDTARYAVEPLFGLTVPASVVFTAGVGEAVAAMLAGEGFERQPAMPAMVLDIDRDLAITELPAGCEFVRLGEGQDGLEWTDVQCAAFALPRGLARRLSPEVMGADLTPNAATQFFGIRRHGRLMATAMLHLADGVAGIYGVATLVEARRQGLGAHVTAAALSAARMMGFHAGVLQSSDLGLPVYLRLGFTVVGEVWTFVRMPAG